MRASVSLKPNKKSGSDCIKRTRCRVFGSDEFLVHGEAIMPSVAFVRAGTNFNTAYACEVIYIGWRYTRPLVLQPYSQKAKSSDRLCVSERGAVAPTAMEKAQCHAPHESDCSKDRGGTMRARFVPRVGRRNWS